MDDIEQTNESLEIPEKAPEEPKKEPSRFTLFLRKLLRWTTGALAIFALGIVLTWIVQVSPRVKEVRALEDQLEAANLQMGDLEDEVSALKDLEEANTTLGISLEETRLHLNILSILVDVSSAQLAINDGNLETAQAALAETDAKLILLLGSLGADQQETLEAMQDRLSLALNEINEDAFAAQNDLEVLRNSILALERSLFGD